MRIAIFSEQPGAAKVDVEHPAPFLKRNVAEFRRTRYASIGNKRIKATELRNCRVNQFPRNVGVGQISVQSDGLSAHFSHRAGDLLLRFRGFPATDCDPRALASCECGLCDPQANRGSDSATSAAYQDSHLFLLKNELPARKPLFPSASMFRFARKRTLHPGGLLPRVFMDVTAD
jgi:hypothetical protein